MILIAPSRRRGTASICCPTSMSKAPAGTFMWCPCSMISSSNVASKMPSKRLRTSACQGDAGVVMRLVWFSISTLSVHSHLSWMKNLRHKKSECSQPLFVPRRDSNPHALNGHGPNHACLPISAPGRVADAFCDPAGIEPRTLSLKADALTIELPGRSPSLRGGKDSQIFSRTNFFDGHAQTSLADFCRVSWAA